MKKFLFFILLGWIFLNFSFKKKNTYLTFQFPGIPYGTSAVIYEYVGKFTVPIDTLKFISEEYKINNNHLKVGNRYAFIVQGLKNTGFDFAGENSNVTISINYINHKLDVSADITPNSNSYFAFNDALLNNTSEELNFIRNASFEYIKDSLEYCEEILLKLQVKRKELIKGNNNPFCKNLSLELDNKKLPVIYYAVRNIEYNSYEILKQSIDETEDFYYYVNRAYISPLGSFLLNQKFEELINLGNHNFINFIKTDTFTNLWKLPPFVTLVNKHLLVNNSYNAVDAYSYLYENYFTKRKFDLYYSQVDMYECQEWNWLIHQLEKGKTAPDFDLRDWVFKNYSLDSLPNKKFILVFYDIYNKNDAEYIYGLSKNYDNFMKDNKVTMPTVYLASTNNDKKRSLQFINSAQAINKDFVLLFNTLNDRNVKNIYGNNIFKGLKIFLFDENKVIYDKWNINETRLLEYLEN